MKLEWLVKRWAQQTPNAEAVRAADGAATYAELDALADDYAHWLVDNGVKPGDLVAFWVDKGLAAIAIMQAILRCGAAYVPLDPKSPPARIQRVVDSCSPKLILATSRRAGRLESGTATILTIDHGVSRATTPFVPCTGGPDDLAYVLFTSGSTGSPKGVCISHRNALAFVTWAAEEVGATSADHFSNHAPFHFDLSVFDVYACFLVGGRLSLPSEMLAYTPGRLVEFIRDEEISIWYSVPSALTMMMDVGLLKDLSLQPRVVIFAGEPFPLKQLVRLRESWQEARMFNFYGPTETNVCTAYELPPGVPTHAVPIGTAASGDSVFIVTEQGRDAEVGEEGELFVEGPTVMLGYLGFEPQGKCYPTGDRVRMGLDGQIEYLGRCDAMLKIRGNRVEPAEVEAALERHPALKCASVALLGSGESEEFVAFAVAELGAKRPSLMEIKRTCAANLPAYMVVDRVEWLDDMPLNDNGKRDSRELHSWIPESGIRGPADETTQVEIGQ